MKLMEKNTGLSPIFARHETFHPRFGWLKKGYDAAVKNSKIFLEEDAAVSLGVGKNMVRSIRYWCSAFGILSEVSCKGSVGKECVPTSLGKQLLDGDGWDPYLESNASLWLLHWKIVQPGGFATAWDYTFNHFHLSEFKEKQLFQSLEGYIQKEYPLTLDTRPSCSPCASCAFA